jgi:hypothetical protein
MRTYQGNVAALNIFENAGKTINYLEIPQAVFTSPEVASVGMTEEEYMEKYNICLCRTISFEHVEKAAAIKDTRGLIRMVVDPKTMQVIGVHMIGPMGKFSLTAGKRESIKIILPIFQYVSKARWATYLHLMSNYPHGSRHSYYSYLCN